MPEREVFLLAGGGHAGVVLEALMASGVQARGVIDPGRTAGSTVFGLPVVGGDEWIDRADPEQILFANGAGLGQGASLSLRRRLFAHGKERGFVFASVRHPSAVVSVTATLREGCQVMAGTVVQHGVDVGVNAVINTRASVDHECSIGSHAFIGPGAILCGQVKVGPEALIGAGAVVLPGVEIGARAVVAAGAVVTRRVADDAFVAGNPASQKQRGHS